MQIEHESDVDEIKFNLKLYAEKGFTFQQAMRKCIGESTWNKMEESEKASFLVAFYSADGVDILQ